MNHANAKGSGCDAQVFGAGHSFQEASEGGCSSGLHLEGEKGQAPRERMAIDARVEAHEVSASR